MEPAIVWAIVTLVVVLVVTWRVDHYMKLVFQQKAVSWAHEELKQRERRLALELSEAIIEETTTLKRAELRRQTAETNSAAEIAEQLHSDRIEAERRVIAADTAARIALAEEFARSTHETTQVNNTSEDVVDRYERYVQGAGARGLANTEILDFADFLALMKEYGQL